MSAIIPESELRIREQKLLEQLSEHPRHGMETVLEAMLVGIAMGNSAVETVLLDDLETLGAVRGAVPQLVYPALARDGLVRFITPKFEATLRDPELGVSTDEVKQLLLASAALGNLRGRTKLG